MTLPCLLLRLITQWLDSSNDFELEQASKHLHTQRTHHFRSHSGSRPSSFLFVPRDQGIAVKLRKEGEQWVVCSTTYYITVLACCIKLRK